MLAIVPMAVTPSARGHANSTAPTLARSHVPPNASRMASPRSRDVPPPFATVGAMDPVKEPAKVVVMDAREAVKEHVTAVALADVMVRLKVKLPEV